MAGFDIEKFVSLSKAVDLSDIDWEEAARVGITDDEHRVLRYMSDTEMHTIIYLRDLLAGHTAARAPGDQAGARRAQALLLLLPPGGEAPARRRLAGAEAMRVHHPPLLGAGRHRRGRAEHAGDDHQPALRRPRVARGLRLHRRDHRQPAGDGVVRPDHPLPRRRARDLPAHRARPLRP